MIELTASQAAVIIALVTALKDGIIEFARYHEALNRVVNMTDEEIEPLAKIEENRTDLLIQGLDEI